MITTVNLEDGMEKGKGTYTEIFPSFPFLSSSLPCASTRLDLKIYKSYTLVYFVCTDVYFQSYFKNHF